MDTVLLQLKTAAAIAILRIKPSEADAYQYTKHLCARYLKAQTQWRSRYLQAQDMILHLKQQQAISFIQSEDVAMLPTPPSSSVEVDSCGQSVVSLTSHEALASSYRFIHAVVSLSTAVGAESLRSSKTHVNTSDSRHTSAFDLSELDSLLTETIPTCVKHLRKVVATGDSDVSTGCVLQGLDGLILLLDAGWTDCAGSGLHYKLLLEQLGSVIDDLLHYLFESDCMAQTFPRRKLQQTMLLHLARQMRVPEKYSLLHSLAAHTKTLCTSMSRDVERGAPVNLNCYEPLALALDGLQQGLASVKVGDIHVESFKEIQQELESAIASSCLIQRFPLVANAVLRLTSMIEACIKSLG